MTRHTVWTIGIISIISLMLNILYPTMSDDYTFRFVWRGDYGPMFCDDAYYPQEPIENIGDVFVSLRSLYWTWGGRMIIWSLAYLFANLPDIVFDLANTAVFMIFLLLITMLGTLTFSLRQLNHRYLILTFLLLWGTSAMFANSYLWLAGSVGYLWPGVAQLLFLFFYVRHYCSDKNTLPRAGYMFILGILAGQTNENSGAVTILLAIFLCICAGREKNLSAAHIAGIIGAMAGYIFLMSAPGNFVRMAATVYSASTYHDMILQRQNVLKGFVCVIPLVLLYFRLNGYHKSCDGLPARKYCLLARCFFVAGALSGAVMLPMPVLPLRAFTFTIVFWLIGALILLSVHTTEFMKDTILVKPGKIYLGVTALSLVAYLYAMAAYFVPQDIERDAAASLSVGQDLELPPYHSPAGLASLVSLKGYRVDCGVIGATASAWPNRVYAAYWGLNSVQREKYFVSDEYLCFDEN